MIRACICLSQLELMFLPCLENAEAQVLSTFYALKRPKDGMCETPTETCGGCFSRLTIFLVLAQPSSNWAPFTRSYYDGLEMDARRRS
ncbi:hypothetical protein V8F06_010157 [Rhypophila decipiens]